MSNHICLLVAVVFGTAIFFFQGSDKSTAVLTIAIVCAVFFGHIHEVLGMIQKKEPLQFSHFFMMLLWVAGGVILADSFRTLGG